VGGDEGLAVGDHPPDSIRSGASALTGRFPPMTAASQTGSAKTGGLLHRRFRISDRGTSVRTELLGGVATFLTMSYILFVNPAILSAAGMPFHAVAVATAIAACVATLAMGLFTNLPFAL